MCRSCYHTPRLCHGVREATGLVADMGCGRRTASVLTLLAFVKFFCSARLRSMRRMFSSCGVNRGRAGVDTCAACSTAHHSTAISLPQIQASHLQLQGSGHRILCAADCTAWYFTGMHYRHAAAVCSASVAPSPQPPHQQVCCLLLMPCQQLLLVDHQLVLHLSHALLPPERELLPCLCEHCFIGGTLLSLLRCKGLTVGNRQGKGDMQMLLSLDCV